MSRYPEPAALTAAILMTAADAYARYADVRAGALLDAERRLQALPGGDDTSLTLVDQRALTAWEAWSARTDGRGGWDWRRARDDVQSDPKHFEAALWAGDVLCGLAVGKASAGRAALNVRLLEGNPSSSHPLRGRVAPFLLLAADRHARALGRRQLRLIDPLPGALPTYLRLGFRLAPVGARPPYCYLDLT